jgi:hypothetical protein
MISETQIRSLIKSTLEVLGDKYALEDAVQLCYEVGLVESRYKYIRQLGDGPAKSFWQVEPATAIDNCQHYLKHRKDMMAKCAEATHIDLMHWQTYDEKIWSDLLEKNIAAGIVHCRLKLWRVPKKMPNSLEGRAHYWKDYYNSSLGAGSVEKYIDVVKEYS